MEQILSGLRAAGEPTRLRLLALLANSELTVSDLMQILGQSQPRVSRHLKLLAEAGLIERYQEGTWVFYRLADRNDQAGNLARTLVTLVPGDDPILVRDLERLSAVKQERADRASAFFEENAGHWDEIRSLHVPEKEVENTLRDMLGDEPVEDLVDLGTGTGRILQILSDRIERGTGIDLSSAMLSVARANLESENLRHCKVRRADIFNLPFNNQETDLVTIHQVLHYLDDPARVVGEAARILRPGGRLLMVDFAPHGMDSLRETQSHQRLGFSDEEVRNWCTGHGLSLTEIRSLPPTGKTGRNVSKNALTVMLWLAEKSRMPAGQLKDTRMNKTAFSASA